MRTLIFAALCASLCGAAIADDWETSPENLSQKEAASYKQAGGLFEDVSLLNLINGLYLKKDQMAEIIKLSKEAQALRDRYLRDSKNVVDEFNAVLAELKDRLLETNAQVPVGCEQKAQGKEHELNEIKKEFFGKLNEIESRLRAVLSEGQLKVINDFNPCLIPPKELKDPVRAGQAGGDYDEIVMHLQHLRNIPEKHFSVIIGPLVEKVVDEHFKPFVKTPEDRTSQQGRVLGVVKKVRACTDAEFAVEKENLARELMSPMISLQSKVSEVTQFFANAHGGISKVGKFMLNPRIVPLLERKMEVAVTETEAKPVQPADSCKDGECGKHSDVEKDALRCRCGEATFAWFEKEFGVPKESSEQLRKVIAKAQIKVLDVLIQPAEDGTVPLVQLFTNPHNLQSIVSQCPAGAGSTYVELITEIKSDLEDDMKSIMGKKNFKKYERSGTDIFKMHCGNLNEIKD